MKYIFYFTFITLTSLVSCSQNQKDNNIVKSEMKFSETQIIDLINIIEKKDDSITKKGFYYHLRYDEFLNENTTIIDIVENKKRPSMEDGFSDIIKLKNGFVFIYDKALSLSDEKLVYAKNNNLVSDVKTSPFFVIHSKYWNLFIQSNKDDLIVKRMKQLLKIQENNEEDELLDF